VILVTGGAGFIGSRLCARLAALGRKVISLDDYSTGSTDNHVAGVDYRHGHTRAIAALVPEPPSQIFHLGEFARVELSFAREQAVLASNRDGTEAVFDYWLGHRCKIVYAGSSTRFACDGSQSPYSLTKRDNADRLMALGRTHRLAHAVAYFYNVYGPGERAGASGTLIEIFRQQRLAGAKLTVVAPGTQRRNFTHVDDIVDGLLLVAEHGIGAFAIGAAESYSVRHVAMMFGGAVEMLPSRKGNRFASSLDTSRIQALGWKQKRRLVEYVNTLLGERAA